MNSRDATATCNVILGIESSCDDTGIAFLKSDTGEVLCSLATSQTDLHREFGGVVPEIAARSHLTDTQRLFKRACDKVGIKPSQISSIAVSQGPGLVGSLIVGASFAKGLGLALNIPVYPINHVHSHVHGALLGVPLGERPSLFPSLAFVISGGHTHLYYMKEPSSFQLLVQSVDDACGEAFDKVAKLLGMEYPGGPKVESLAKNGDPKRFPMPKMVAKKADLFFSYSGLKTAVNRYVKDLLFTSGSLSSQDLADLCASFQQAAFDQLVRKLKLALEKSPETRSVIIAGGVAANGHFREQLLAFCPVPVVFPKLEYCSDNGAMIAALGLCAAQCHPSPPRGWDVFSTYSL